MNCVKHNFFEPGYQCKDCTIEDLRARVAELEAAAEAYKSEVATCHRNEGDRIRYREALVGTAASLAAAISLLERGSKKAAPSDKMFDQMIRDYKKSLDSARAILNQK